MKWERLTAIRTWLLVIIGLASLCTAAYLWDLTAFFAALGLASLLLAYLTDPNAGGS